MMDTGSRNPRVLVVDDDDSIRILVKSLLRHEGFEVECARDGIEAIEMLSKSDYDAVILDVMMPRLDGIGVVRHLAINDRDALNHTILLTASHADDIWEQPVFDVVTKPFDIHYFVEKTRQCAAVDSRRKSA
jgi:CheY-like chemotaxis protein